MNELEQDIVINAIAYVEAQTRKGKLQREHGKILSGTDYPSPTRFLRKRALELIGEDEKKIEDWERIIREKEAILKSLVMAHPLWKEWAWAVRGLGPVVTGIVMAGIGDVTRVNHASGLWKSFGLDVDQKTGLARKPKRGEKGPRGHPFARLVLGRFRVHFMKQWKLDESRGKPPSFYCRIYTQARNYYETERDWPQGRAFGAALRKFEKIFLAHFLKVYRLVKDLPTPVPYIVLKEGHQEILPQEAMEKVERRRRIR